MQLQIEFPGFEEARKIFNNKGHRLIPIGTGTRILGYQMLNDYAIEFSDVVFPRAVTIEGGDYPESRYIGICVIRDNEVITEHSKLFNTLQDAQEYCNSL